MGRRSPESDRRTLRQKLKVAEETHHGYVVAIAEARQNGGKPSAALLKKEVDAMREITRLSRALVELMRKG
jgi:hypothetical protein